MITNSPDLFVCAILLEENASPSGVGCIVDVAYEMQIFADLLCHPVGAGWWDLGNLGQQEGG